MSPFGVLLLPDLQKALAWLNQACKCAFVLDSNSDFNCTSNSARSRSWDRTQATVQTTGDAMAGKSCFKLNLQPSMMAITTAHY